MTSGQCKCKVGYFDDNTNAACKSCHYSCKTCTGKLLNECIDC
jgi:hypothetical protein